MGLQRTPPTRSQPLPSVSPIPPPLHNPSQDQPIQENVEIPVHQEQERENVEGNKTMEGDKTTLSIISDSKAFVPRHPGVMRTPPGGRVQSNLNASQLGRIEHIDERPIRPAPTPSPIPEYRESTAPQAGEPTQTVSEPMQLDVNVDVNVVTIDNNSTSQIEDDERATEDLLQDTTIVEEDFNAMDVDEPVAESQPSNHSPVLPQFPSTSAQIPQNRTTPAPTNTQASSSTAPIVPTTPAARSNVPKTPRSRRKTTEPLPSPPKLVPLQVEDEYEYGRRYQLTMETLERAVKAGAQRWTAEHLKGCFPQLSKQLGKAMEQTCLAASQSMRENILTNAKTHLVHYKVGPSLKLIDEVDKEAREYHKSNPSDSEIGKLGRPDAWRPDLSPDALIASSLLPIYDESYARLRAEYLELHQNCTERYKSIIEKQNLLNEYENGVADGVIDLEKTIEILDKLPTDDMMIWTEATETKLETRAPEQIQ